MVTKGTVYGDKRYGQKTVPFVTILLKAVENSFSKKRQKVRDFDLCYLFLLIFRCVYCIIVSTRKEAIVLTSTIRRWGNSAAVRIPRDILTQANLEEGVNVEIVLTKEKEITLRAIRKRQTIQELFADYDGGFFQTEELDWGKPQGDEVW
jgi:antitoxin MazE